ncbi:MAG TPA: MFS transporter, partial [Deinococcales bacterium]|nr:MFS transporter [Deinococcales bacterium]
MTAQAAGRAGFTTRALGALFMAQALSAGAVTVSTSLSSIIATRLTGSEALSGLPATINMVASAVAAALVGRLMAARGRRFGLLTGYALGGLGCFLAAAFAIRGSFPGFLVGSAMVGMARGGTDQARYAAAELVPQEARGRTIGLFLSGSVVGAVLAASLTPLVRGAAERAAIPEIEAGWLLAGLFMMAGGLLAT